MLTRSTLIAACLALVTAGCLPSEPSSDQTDAESIHRASDTDALVLASLDGIIPEHNISIGDYYLEIDDLDLLGPGDRDANFCSSASAGQGYAACPPSVFGTGFDADNPNYPGPDPANPATLGAEADYLDWADLDFTDHFVPFLDNELQDPPVPDDIFQPGACYDTGNSPSKANLTVNGFAANDDYLYLLSERETSNGQEEHHYYFTNTPPVLAAHPDCPEDTWLWTMEDGDIEITLRFQSTSGLPFADVVIKEWSGGTVSGVTAPGLILAETWDIINPEGVAYVALNVSNDKKADPDEDVEYDFDGSALDSGLKAEVALDIAAVFGDGCGLKRTVAIISTASGSGGRRDDIKDVSGPYTIETGTLTPSLTLYESCDEEFGYLVELGIEASDGSITPIPLPDADMAVELTYDCGDGPVVLTSPFLPDDFIAEPVDSTATCTVSVSFVGSGEYDGCDTEVSGSVNIYPLLEAQGSLDETCEGTYSWDGEILASSGAATVLWTFDITDGPSVYPTATTTDLDGSAALASATTYFGPALVEATLVVTDSQTRDSVYGELTCTSSPEVQGILAMRPLLVDLPTQTGDGTCPTDDVETAYFDAVVLGGSGGWTFDWTATDDAVLDGTCAALGDVDDADASLIQGCNFNLGSDFCAEGSITLLVTDDNPECDPASDVVSAVRTSSLDVTPDPL